MKKNLLISIWFTLATTVLLGIIYPLVVTGIAQVIFPKQANGELIKSGDKLVGSHLIGQPFTQPGYFWSRPSAAGSFVRIESGSDEQGAAGPRHRERPAASADQSEHAHSGRPGDHLRIGSRSRYFSGVR